MPIYEYRCTDCGKVSEKLVGVVSEPGDLRCDHCGADTITRVFSPVSFTLRRTPSPCASCPGREPTTACEAVGCPNVG